MRLKPRPAPTALQLPSSSTVRGRTPAFAIAAWATRRVFEPSSREIIGWSSSSAGRMGFRLVEFRLKLFGARRRS